MASQCAGPGFAANLAMVVTVNMMSRQVVSMAQLSALTASWYGTLCMTACLAALEGVSSVESQMEVSIGMDNGLRSERL